jgi:5-methylcytosine-specific restriction endonuclease McrA
MNSANNGGKWIRQERRYAIYYRDKHSCSYCGKQIKELKDYTLDHIKPQELGGSNRSSNLVTACKACNSAKQAKPLRAFLDCLKSKYGIDPEEVKKRIRRRTRRKLVNGSKF